MTTKTLVQELKELKEKIEKGTDCLVCNGTGLFSFVDDIKCYCCASGKTNMTDKEIYGLLTPILAHAEQKETEDEKHRLTADELQIINLELGVGVSHVIRDKLRHWSKGKTI